MPIIVAVHWLVVDYLNYHFDVVLVVVAYIHEVFVDALDFVDVHVPDIPDLDVCSSFVDVVDNQDEVHHVVLYYQDMDNLDILFDEYPFVAGIVVVDVSYVAVPLVSDNLDYMTYYYDDLFLDHVDHMVVDILDVVLIVINVVVVLVVLLVVVVVFVALVAVIVEMVVVVVVVVVFEVVELLQVEHLQVMF
eukprot:CAMPEP_0201580972 /NCGR_PEP_ID=MMETSP0190_2-20130828/59860_1 /ASSEMBLY_ACC=CAM_ASM_000263 /TAXON_ID=37353 /ORGANISM="Rosalina sp." /LENGTH=190 /DNA_ID=CAMNT_0048018051 /DNA_START=152 /DNA_END=724 /DNA_ORIENTATION=+